MIQITFIILAILTTLSFVYRWREKELKAFTLCGTLAVLLCVLVLFNHPAENKITTQILSIEPKLNQISKNQEELAYVSNELINIIDQLQKQDSVWNDEPKKNGQIEKSILSLQQHLNTEFNREDTLFKNNEK